MNDKILEISKRLDDFVIEMITRHYLIEEGKLGESYTVKKIK